MNDCSSIMFFGITDTLSISGKDYKIVEIDSELEIKFDNLEVVEQVETIKCNKVRFCIDGKTLVAKSNPVFSSTVPDDAEYFFSTNADGSLMNLKGEKTLYMRKITN